MRALKLQRPDITHSGYSRQPRLLVVCQGAESPSPRSGAVRRVKRRKSKLLALDVLEHVCKRGSHLTEAFNRLEQGAGQQHSGTAKTTRQEDLYIRFPSLEFRSLVLNPLAKSGLMHPFPDRAVWNKHKVELAHLVLQLASKDSSYRAGLQRMVDIGLERDRYNLQRALQDEQLGPEDKERCRKRYELRCSKVHADFDGWCRATVNNPHFQLLKPVLQQVLQVEPALPLDNRRDGSRTEAAISALIERELPPGWSMHTQCRIVAVDGEVFRNEKLLKGEADVLLADAQGIVQAVLEVKTARGNPYLALYEDLQRFRNMTERVRGRLVSFTPAGPPGGGPSTQHHHAHPAASHHASSAAASAAMPAAPITRAAPAAAAVAAPAAAAMAASGGSGSAGADDGAPPVVTLRFSKNVKPIYVLGSAIEPQDVEAVVRSAQSKLLTMELGRVLSTQIDAWKDISLVEFNRDAAIVQVPPSSFPQCASNVRDYFKRLEACHVYMVQTN